ncbi:hypothetical protein GQ55_3G465000 [Panicum hallii var. hallii]|uniref:PB1 domain-containing protein n=1 Tax=Panicum hallii var. hallii TaxID=1504633 RepID=A0A2T7EJ19_9POAL|nr:hypothetical protein GQ55_3G465000 [Panicum hallii var. hallii]
MASRRNTRSKWYSFSKVVDVDTTNFKDLVEKIEDKYPCGYGDVVKLFYYAADTKSNIEVTSDQELLDMFDKHISTKKYYLSIAYHAPSVEPPPIPVSDDCVDFPCTPSIPVPLAIDGSHSHFTQTLACSEINVEDNFLENPEPENEHVGVDEEGLYIDIEDGNATDWDEDGKAEPDHNYEGLSDSKADSNSNSDYVENEADEMVKDKLPPHNPKIVKKNPHEHDCHSTRRSGKVKCATKYWVCEKEKDWVLENPKVTAKELQRRIKDEYKVLLHYKRVYHGRELALTELFGDWKENFDNL